MIGNGVTSVTIEVSRSGLTAARQEEMLNIYTGDPHYRHLQVPITLMKANRLEVSATPERIELTGSGSQLVRLRAAGDKTVRIEKAECDHPGVKCTWASGPGNDATLRISVDAAQFTTAAATVHVRLTEPSAMTLNIPVAVRKE